MTGVISAAVQVSEKFVFYRDLGIICVPSKYDHSTQIADFKLRHQEFKYWNDDATDQNFSNPSRILKPGERLQVDICKSTVAQTTSEERMAFLVSRNAIHTGAQGLTLIWDQKSQLIPFGPVLYSSFDHKDHLLVKGKHQVPSVIFNRDEDPCFGLAEFDTVWHEDHFFFCVTESKFVPLV